MSGLLGNIARLLRPKGRSVGGRPADQPDWSALIDAQPELWAQARERAKRGPRVLIATNVGGHVPVNIMESFLAVVLTWRGASVTTLLCDGVLPGCLKAEHVDLPDPEDIAERRLPQKLCASCRWRGEASVQDLGTDVVRIGALLDESQKLEARRIADTIPVHQIADYRYEGLAVGEHALAGALRYYARGDLARERQGEAVLRRYLEAALLSVHATRRVIRERKIEIAVFHHGLYVPQGIVGEVCRSMGVKVVNWFVSYRTSTFLFSHGDTYHHTLMTEPTDIWESMPWGDGSRRAITDYLKSRWYGTRDWISFHEKPDTEFPAFAQSVGIDFDKPIIGLLTNVVWDAQLHYPANAFPNMIDWILKTITYFAKRPELQLLIRVHPAEIRGTVRSRQPIVDEISAAFPTLPPNVFVIGPESPVSTYAAMERCDSVIIYGTKTGVELTSVGIPTIVAGEAWIRNKGLTHDAASEGEYFRILARLPFGRRLDAAAVDRALRYAFHFFFRRMIPLPFMRPTGRSNLYMPAVERLSDLDPNRFPGLDVICEGILRGAPFVYPSEKIDIREGSAA